MLKLDYLIKFSEIFIDYKNIHKIIPDSGAVYFVFFQNPASEFQLIYVGTNTGKSKRFRTRVGDLIADSFGLFVEDETGHHSGGQKIYKWVIKNEMNPQELLLGWKKFKDYNQAEKKYTSEYKSKLLNGRKNQIDKVEIGNGAIVKIRVKRLKS